MDAKTNLKSRVRSRYVTEGSARAPHQCSWKLADGRINRRQNATVVLAALGGATSAALHLTANAHECGIAFDLRDANEVFKRTSCIAGLKPAGRFVAKDLFKTRDSPMPMKTLRGSGFAHGDCMTLSGFGMAENFKRVARKFRPGRCSSGGLHLRDGNNAAERGSLEVQLSDAAFEKRWAAWQPQGSAFGLWKHARQVGSARHGAVTHPGRRAEKACHADI